MFDKQRKPKRGEWASARKVIHGDGRDTYRQEGVIVGVPRKRGEYYRVLSPLDPDRPFNGHVDDAEYVPEASLGPADKQFKDYVKRGLNSQE